MSDESVNEQILRELYETNGNINPNWRSARHELSERAYDSLRDESTELTEDQKLLRKQTLYEIEHNPDQFYMGAWDTSYMDEQERFDVGGVCGTTRCIAGWALHLAGRPVSRTDSESSIEARAIEVLGLSESEYKPDSGRTGLFYTSDTRAVEQLRAITEVL